MAVCLDDDDVWACPRHPSKRRRSGICAVCLYDRLASLCPDCARALPCSCSARATTTSPSSSSSSSSFSLFSFSLAGVAGGGDAPITAIGSVGRVASLIECEPAFRRSRSIAVPFLRSKNPDPVADSGSGLESDRGKSKTASSFWRLFKLNRGERKTTAATMTTISRSRSVAVSDCGAGESHFSPATTGKGKTWYFPSPIKAFRRSRVSKMVFQQPSPLYRG